MPSQETCVFSFSELVKMSAMGVKEFYEMFQGRSGQKAMEFRREIQKGIRDYARQVHGMDLVKQELLVKCQMIEKWCRTRFYKEQVKFFQNTGLPYITAKACARKEWEDYCARQQF